MAKSEILVEVRAGRWDDRDSEPQTRVTVSSNCSSNNGSEKIGKETCRIEAGKSGTVRRD